MQELGSVSLSTALLNWRILYCQVHLLKFGRKNSLGQYLNLSETPTSHSRADHAGHLNHSMSRVIPAEASLAKHHKPRQQ